MSRVETTGSSKLIVGSCWIIGNSLSVLYDSLKHPFVQKVVLKSEFACVGVVV